jgi:hypothetical protein
MGNPNVRIKPSTGRVFNYSGVTGGGSAEGQQLVMDANQSRTYLVFQNNSDTLMRINFANYAVPDDSIAVQPGGSVTFNSAWVPSDAVYLVCTSTGKSFVAKEGI